MIDMPALSSEPLESEPLESESPIANQRVAFVGKLGGMNRREARELVRRNGGVMVDRVDATVNLIVIGADVMPFDEPMELLDDWVVEATASGRVVVINETQFWQNLGLVESEVEMGQLYTPAMLAGLLEIRIATVRRWHRRGLITPTRQVNKLPYFDFQEVASARRLASLISSGATPQAIETKLSRLAGLYPNLRRPLSQLSVIVQGRSILLRQGEGLVEPGGQRRIDFELLDQPATSSFNSTLSWEEERGKSAQSVKSVNDLATLDEFIEMAIDFEDQGDPSSAIEVYRALMLAFGPSADVCFRIAELLYQQFDLSAARERYSVAIELDETFVEARASLGCVLVDLGQPEFALSAFEGALHFHADYPDVHFHLARLLDDLDRGDEAEGHWEQFLELAPQSPWSDEARDRLSGQH